MTSPTRPRLACRPLVGVVVGVLLLAGCGEDRAGDLTAGQDPSAAPASGPAVLPTLPPIAERHAGRFGPDGCAITSNGPDCSVTADAIDQAQAGTSEAEWRVLEGFAGPRYTIELAGSTLVLEDTVTTSSSGGWRATGLVRNEQPVAVGPVTVSATLLDASGTVLATATGDALLAVLRPGEPAPFEIRADVDAASVAEVRWSVAAPAATSSPSRSLEIGVLWQRGVDDPRPVDMYLFRDPATGPHPLVVFGSAQAVGDGPVEGAGVVGAWLDGDGRVVAVARATVVRPEGIAIDEGGPARSGEVAAAVVDPASSPTLAPGEIADVLFVLDASAAPVDVDDAQLVLWGTGA
jgi:hypothetical protein